MKNISTKLLVIMLVLFSGSTYAQFTIDGQFKTRFQVLHGHKKPVAAETDALFGVDQQSRLIFNYKTDKIATKLTLQDARVWGSDDRYNPTGTQGNSFGFGIYEAWAQLKVGDYSHLRIGRQEWLYNRSRLLSHRGWWTTGLSYDGLLYMMHKKETGLFVDLGLSYNNAMNPNNGSYVNNLIGRLKTVNFLNVKKVFNNKFNATFNFMFTGKQDDLNPSVLYMKATEGIILDYNYGKKGEGGLFGTFSAYYQHGTNANAGGGNSKTSAYMFDAQVGFRTSDKKLELSAGVEMLSGHDQSNTDSLYNTIHHTFDLFGGGPHPYYGGYMDYYVVPKSTKNGGLMDGKFH